MEIEMTVKGLGIDPITNMPIIVLRDREGQRTLPIWVGVFEANAIALQMENVQTPRPMTHDLLKSVLDGLSARVERVVVCALRDNTFYAMIHVKTEHGSQAVDARPSDAIALALRAAAPIYVDDSVLQEAVTTEGRETVDVKRIQSWLEDLPEEDLGKYKM